MVVQILFIILFYFYHYFNNNIMSKINKTYQINSISIKTI